MPLATGRRPLGEGLFEFTATVRLYQLHPAAEAPCQGLLQEGTPIRGGQGRRVESMARSLERLPESPIPGTVRQVEADRT